MHSFNGSLEYNTDLFEASTITHFINRFKLLLNSIVANPEQRIGTYPLLTAKEENQLLVSWNDNNGDYPQNKCIQQLFEEHAQRTPEAIALVFETQTFTYAALNQQANQLAHYLRNLGVGPDVFVGIYLEPISEMVLSVLAILKAGAAYLPLDPSYPQERLAFMLQDTATPVVLTLSPFLESLPQSKATVVCLDQDWAAISKEDDSNLSALTTPQNLAYVIYTSGSTGRSKGVCCYHAAVLNFLASFERWSPLGVGDNVSLWTSLNFDVSVYDMFSALVSGATLHIVPQSIRPDTQLFMGWLVQNQIHSAYLPPFMLVDFANWLRGAAPPPPLKRLLVGVEPILEQTLVHISQSIPELQIINGYGPSEATVCSTLYPVPVYSSRIGNAPIGCPLQNLDVYLLDQHLSPVPIGVPGELHVGGVALARGYLKRPALTAQMFIPHPFCDVPGKRLYKTGDLARYLPDGNMMFIGRQDYQVKVRGFRIELGEIESVLIKHPLIKNGAVIAYDDAHGIKQLIMYFVPKQNQAVTNHNLRQFLQAKLPAYMIPSIFMPLDDLPLTPNGKIDRKALPLPDLSSLASDDDFVAPRTQQEALLADIWQSVLGIDSISVHHNFFDLGGHSLLATQVISQIRQRLALDIPLRDLFEYPSIAKFSDHISHTYQSTQPLVFSTLEARSALSPHLETAPLSFAQERLWVLNQLQPYQPTHNMSTLLYLDGRLNVPLLDQSFTEIIVRHNVLRTTLELNASGTPLQVIAPPQAFHLTQIDLNLLPPKYQPFAIQDLINQEIKRPFNLSSPPLFRITLIKLKKTAHRLLITMHQTIGDAHSMDVLIQELSLLYQTKMQRKSSPLSLVSIQYADFAQWQTHPIT